MNDEEVFTDEEVFIDSSKEVNNTVQVSPSDNLSQIFNKGYEEGYHNAKSNLDYIPPKKYENPLFQKEYSRGFMKGYNKGFLWS